MTELVSTINNVNLQKSSVYKVYFTAVWSAVTFTVIITIIAKEIILNNLVGHQEHVICLAEGAIHV